MTRVIGNHWKPTPTLCRIGVGTHLKSMLLRHQFILYLLIFPIHEYIATTILHIATDVLSNMKKKRTLCVKSLYNQLGLPVYF